MVFGTGESVLRFPTDGAGSCGRNRMIELSEVIRELRAELETAMAAAPADGLRLELGPVEIEVSLGVDKSASGGAKVRFWVIEMGPEASVARSSLQRLKLTLVPSLGHAEGRPFVAGAEVAGER